MCLAGWRRSHRLPRCPAERRLRRAGANPPASAVPSWPVRAPRAQQAGEFLGAEAVGAGGDEEFAKLEFPGLVLCPAGPPGHQARRRRW